MTQKPDPNIIKAPKVRKGRRKNSSLPKLIGVFVLAAGLAAFIAVLYLGYVKFVNVDQIGGEQVAQGSGMPGIEQANTAGAQQDRSRLDLKKATLRQMRGSWRTKYGVITATLSLDDANMFELILYMDAVGFERLITTGTYTYDEEEGIMRLQPSSDRPPRIEGADISPLTYRSYNIVVLRKANDGNILWVPHIKEGYRDQIHPVFVKMGVRDEYIEWSPLR